MLGAVTEASVMFSDLWTKMDFLVVDKAPLRVLIGIAEMAQLNRQIYLSSQKDDLTVGRDSSQAGLEFDKIIGKIIGDLLENKYFTTVFRDTSSADESDEESEKSMLVALAVGDEGLKHLKD